MMANTLSFLNEQEQAQLRWLKQTLGAFWLSYLPLSKKLHEGESLADNEAKLDLLFSPVAIDARLLYAFVKKKGGYVIPSFSQNKQQAQLETGDVFFFLTNAKKSRILHMSVERFERGAFVESVTLSERANEAWAKEAALLISEGNLEDLFELLSLWRRHNEALKGRVLACVAVVNLDFTRVLERWWIRSEEGKTVPLFFWGLEAISEAYQEGAIATYPKAPIAHHLRYFSPLIQRTKYIFRTFSVLGKYLPF